MVLLDDLVEQRSKGVEALVATCVHTDARVGPFATGEDALLEGVAILVLFVFAGVPHISGEHLGQQTLGSAWEEGEALDFLGALEVWPHHHAVDVDGVGDLRTHFILSEFSGFIAVPSKVWTNTSEFINYKLAVVNYRRNLNCVGAQFNREFRGLSILIGS